MTYGFLCILGHQRLEFTLGPLMVEEGLPGVAEQPGKLGPGVGGAHVDHADGFNPRPAAARH